MFFCASRKTEAICVRRAFSGVSRGASKVADEALDAVEVRGLSVADDDLWETAAEEVRVDLVEVRAGMIKH